VTEPTREGEAADPANADRAAVEEAATPREEADVEVVTPRDQHWIVHPLVLEGEVVRLEPMERHHTRALCEVGLDPELWRWTMSRATDEAGMRRYVQAALSARDEESAYPFVTIERSSGRVIGSTRYGNLAPEHRRLEIGWTWIAPPWQRSAVNTEAKYLMLRHAFDVLGCNRVELKTDVLNQRSRDAMLRIGAREEGVLRRHAITDDGRVRDTVYFSIIADEWPGVRTRLEQRLAR